MTPAKKSTQQPKQRVIAPSPKKIALFLSLHVWNGGEEWT